MTGIFARMIFAMKQDNAFIQPSLVMTAMHALSTRVMTVNALITPLLATTTIPAPPIRA